MSIWTIGGGITIPAFWIALICRLEHLLLHLMLCFGDIRRLDLLTVTEDMADELFNLKIGLKLEPPRDSRLQTQGNKRTNASSLETLAESDQRHLRGSPKATLGGKQESQPSGTMGCWQERYILHQSQVMIHCNFWGNEKPWEHHEEFWHVLNIRSPIGQTRSARPQARAIC